MLHIHWRKLGEAASIYTIQRAVYPDKPLDPNEPKYSQTIDDPSPEAIVHFLKGWGRMRMSFDPNKIQRSIEEAKSVLTKLSAYNFETASLSETRCDVVSAFHHFLNGTRSPVATSKTLHVLAPRFFVMWDNAIRIAYGCGDYMESNSPLWGNKYFTYLERVQRCLKEALMLYAKNHAIQNMGQASERLKAELYEHGGKSLAKIVDEYNFLKYTKGREELWIDS